MRLAPGLPARKLGHDEHSRSEGDRGARPCHALRVEARAKQPGGRQLAVERLRRRRSHERGCEPELGRELRAGRTGPEMFPEGAEPGVVVHGPVERERGEPPRVLAPGQNVTRG